MDVIKVRMQADRAGTLYRGVGDAFAKIYKHEGVRGFLRVSAPNCRPKRLKAETGSLTLRLFYSVGRGCRPTSSAGSS